MAQKEVPNVVAGTHHSGPRGLTETARSSIQEWTGTSWAVVQLLDGPGQREPEPLDASAFPGQYVGQRVVTA